MKEHKPLVSHHFINQLPSLASGSKLLTALQTQLSALNALVATLWIPNSRLIGHELPAGGLNLQSRLPSLRRPQFIPARETAERPIVGTSGINSPCPIHLPPPTLSLRSRKCQQLVVPYHLPRMVITSGETEQE